MPSTWFHLCGLLVATALLVGCAPSEGSSSVSATLSSSSDAESAFTVEDLLTRSYSITDPAVRTLLTKARLPFSVRLEHGRYEFPASALMGDYQSVRVESSLAAFGDLTGDGSMDAVVPLVIGEGEFPVTEVAVIELQNGEAVHTTSFPLSHATVQSMDITSGKIRVRIRHTVPGDPGPRVTELALEL